MSPYSRLLNYALRYRRDFLIGFACVLVSRTIMLASPAVLGYAIDDLRRNVTGAKLAGYGLLLLLIGVVGGFFLFLMRRVVIGASRHVEYDVRNDFFAHLEKLPLAYFQSHRTGDLMSRATNDLNAVRMMVGPAVMYSASTIFTFVVALTMMLTIDARLTLWALIPLPFVSISVKYFGIEIHRRFEQIQAQLSEISAVAQEALSGVRVVRAYRQEDAELERFRRSNQEYFDRNRRLIVVQGFYFPSMAFFLGLGALLVLWLGSGEVIRGRITLGQFVAFNAYLTMLSWPMIAFGWVTNMLQRGMASWKRMLQVFDVEPSIQDISAAATAESTSESPNTGDSPPSVTHRGIIRGEIEFRDLTFAYSGQPVLTHVSARIEAGQTVALVGVTGSGKSTLMHLIARLHDPPIGTVFVDGIDVRAMPLFLLRGTIGFVPQEPFLFSDTLADNVGFGLDATPEAMGSPEERMRRVLKAAEVARLDKDVAEFPKGYDTMVGERGITLSGGQKQRTAIAGAVATDPRILILDDALSAVDTYTEKEILSRLRGVMRQRTSILVSHRISTVREADQIFVMDEGRIVERGTHEDLIRKRGVYAELHRKQLLEEELAAS